MYNAFNALNNSFNNNGINSMYNLFRTANNPAAMLTALAQSNPAVNNVLQMIKGRNPREVFYEECKKRGVNPEDILNKMK